MSLTYDVLKDDVRAGRPIDFGFVTYVPERTCRIMSYIDESPASYGGRVHRCSACGKALPKALFRNGWTALDYCPRCGARVVGDSTYPDLIGIIADHDGWYPAADAADRLADLIEPSCDRDALLALAEDVTYSATVAAVMDASKSAKLLAEMLLDIASRIREACGEVVE